MIKNNQNVTAIAKYHVLIAAASRLAMACLTNDLSLYTGYGFENELPYLEFKVHAGPEGIVLYSGKIFDSENEMMDAIVDSIIGKMVSEVSPPAETFYDGKKVIYWRRELVNRIDATRLGVNRPEHTQAKAQISWVGFDVAHKEIVRISDGASNPGNETVDRVEYVDIGPLGTVVAIVPHNLIKDETFPPSLGESIWLKERNDIAMRLELDKINELALQTDQMTGLSTNFSETLLSAQLGMLSTTQVETLSVQLTSALTTSQLATLSTSNVIELQAQELDRQDTTHLLSSANMASRLEESMEQLFGSKQNSIVDNVVALEPLAWVKAPTDDRSVAAQVQTWISEGMDPTTAERVFVVSDRDYPHDLPMEVISTVHGFRGTKAEVTFLVPVVHQREEYDQLPPIGRQVYLDFIDGYRQLVQDETVKVQTPDLHEHFCKFLRSVVESDMFHKAWTGSMESLGAGELNEFPTRSVFAAGFLQFSDEVMIELFGKEDPSRTAKTIDIPSEIGIIELSKKLKLSQQFVIDFLRQSNYIVHPDQGLDFPVSSKVVNKLGWNAVETNPPVVEQEAASLE